MVMHSTATASAGSGAPALAESGQLLWDGSAGMFSWEAFSAYAEVAVAQTARREGSLSLLLLALDLSIDRVVAPWGETLEDDAIRIARATVLRTARTGDIVGRQGRASFAVVAADAQQAGVLRLAERLQSAFAEAFKLMDPAVRWGVSIGVASSPQAGRTLTELLESAAEALHRSVAAGRNRVVVGGSSAGMAAPIAASYTLPAAVTQYDQLTIQRRAAFRYLTQAVARGQIEGIAVQPLPSACPVCLDAARDVYRPSWAPELPLAGCTGPVGCRCVFGSPALDPARRQLRRASASYGIEDVPRKLRDAARFAGESNRGCKPEDLAEYLEGHPLLPLPLNLGLPADEPVYLARPAQRAWEGSTGTGSAGLMLPVAAPMPPWVKRAGKLSALPSDAQQFPEAGTLYLTSQRLLFGKPGALESVLLSDMPSVECFRDGIACAVANFGNRMIFLLRDPMHVGLYLARVVRDALLPPR